MYNPVSTYRIQFNKNFNFSDFENIIPYLYKLGIKTIYASPILQAIPGSNHGYDALDPKKINSEIGTEEQLLKIKAQLKEYNIGWLQDIVPNHMAFNVQNPWIYDILENGENSEYAKYFDINWSQKPLMLPVLGKNLEEALQDGEIKIKYSHDKFIISYYENSFPLQMSSLEDVVKTYEQLGSTEEFEKFLANILLEINSSPDVLLKILNEQHYRLCHWQETDHQINFRRFFTINGLICLNIQDEIVFKDFHAYLKNLIDKNIIDGLRIDHIDGLYDPSKYLDQLRELAGNDAYIVVEKILEKEEKLPEYWSVQGTTGYEFLATVNNLFTLKDSEEIFSQAYSSKTDSHKTIHQHIKDKKSFILFTQMQGELQNLLKLLLQSNLLTDQEIQNISIDDLKKAIAEFLIVCPVYRYYSNSFPLLHIEAEFISHIFSQLYQSHPHIEKAITALERIFCKTTENLSEVEQVNTAHFFKRCMQFTGPLMAKGVEDTLMYTYNRFIAHNEVGDSPDSFGLSVDEFHLKMKMRQQEWPMAINTTATHDTKRGEDARARLNVLSEISIEWFHKVDEWQQLSSSFKTHDAPDANDEYFIYQSLVASYPMPGEVQDNFKERILAYLEKAFREAKRHTNWSIPNKEYEKATSVFVQNLLTEENAFYKSFTELVSSIADFGIINSLVQLILKCSCPGVPDIYQGTELWDLSFVDPDNRRSIDFKKRNIFLKEFEEPISVENLWKERYNGKIKLWLQHYLLKERASEPELFLKGAYIPLQVKGKYKKHILAFARKHEGKSFIVIVPIHIAVLCKKQKKSWDQLNWEDTTIEIPDAVTGNAYFVVDDLQIEINDSIQAADLFKKMPLALFKISAPRNKRSAGVLLHITSLPSPFGIGDLGKEARQFANFLIRCKQKYWQILPLNPIEEAQGFSPYSSTSSMAGNTLLINPYELTRVGLLQEDDLAEFSLPSKSKVNFKKAEHIRNILLKKAWQNFNEKSIKENLENFNNFCITEKEWLDDFALYVVLKKHFKNKPWYEWPQQYKKRDTAVLSKIIVTKADEVKYQKWLQYIFHKQWIDLKTYCNKSGIKLFGDLPFYISYDSADVWALSHLFKLDKDAAILGIAGVPPDAFSEDGQLWGMPVFNWHKMKDENYKWWVNRLKKNVELYDLVRLDHFRAFSAYWEVPAGETTAKKGKWKQGPGKVFFEVIKKELGKLPFIAEDLGDIDEAVYDLRDSFDFPGMKVLQFAFGADMPASPHIPHNYEKNYVVYTGTHDNNTTKGWYRGDVKLKKNLENYLNKKVSEKDVASEMAKLAFASVANIAILPLQDILALDETARMNMPSSPSGNWNWRLIPNQINKEAQHYLLEITETYNRK